MNKILSPIGIDLGSKYTGVYSVNIINNKWKDAKRTTIEIDKNNFTLSQPIRRTTRHALRNRKRKDLAKRLTDIICDDIFGSDTYIVNGKLWILVHRLLNNRGYNYVSVDGEAEESWCEYLDELVEYELDKHDDIKNLSFDERLSYLYENYNEDVYQKLINEVKSNEDKDKEKRLVFKYIIEWNNNRIKELDEGHFHRKIYFKNILDDLINHQDYVYLRHKLDEINMKYVEFINILGHINNLQLKQLRRYFNQPIQKIDTATYDNKLFKEIFKYFVDNIHPKTVEDREQLKELHALINNYNDNQGVKFYCHLSKINPESSIPPYEDQNNRDIPVCQTLKLNPFYLDKNYVNWVDWVERLKKIDSSLIFGSQEAEDIFWDVLDFNNSKVVWKSIYAATVLQRFLDKAIYVDEFNIRKLVNKQLDEISHIEAIGNINTKLGETNKLLDLAKMYYQQRIDVTTGAANSIDGYKKVLNNQDDSSLLYVCLHHNKHKNNQQGINLSRILMLDYTQYRLRIEEFIKLWEEKKLEKVKNSHISNFCVELEKIRKKHGNAFKYKLDAILYKAERENWSDKERAKDEVIKSYDRLNDFAQIIANFFGIENEEHVSKFANWFSLAQLDNLLNKSSSGFSSTCQSCAKENAYRNRLTNDSGVMFNHLPVQAGRPFDGVVGRLLDKISYEVAKFKLPSLIEIIKNKPDSCVAIPIICEQNSFEFEEDLKDIKNKKSDKNAQDDYLDKKARILNFSMGISAYDGTKIDLKSCEIDHIIPRHESIKKYGTVFNSEANLMALSINDNQKKGGGKYFFANLHDDYKQAIFNKDTWGNNDESIKTKIGETLSKIKKYTNFNNLSNEEKVALKHALLLGGEEKYKNTFNLAITLLKGELNRAKVNGSQKYFSRLLSQKIQNLLKQQLNLTHTELNQRIKIMPVFIDGNIVSQHRKILSEATDYSTGEVIGQPFRKGSWIGKQQDIESHTIDAYLTFVSYYFDPRNKVAPRNEVGEYFYPNENYLIEEFNQSVFTLNVVKRTSLASREEKYGNSGTQSMKMFKDGLLGENFVNLFIAKVDGVYSLYYGLTFNKKHSIKLAKKESFEDYFNQIKDYLLIYKNNLKYNYCEYVDFLESNKGNKTYLPFTINKNKVFEFFNQISNKEVSIFDEKGKLNKLGLTAKILNDLSFNTVKFALPDSITTETISKSYFESYKSNNIDVIQLFTHKTIEGLTTIKVLGNQINFNIEIWERLSKFLQEKIKPYCESYEVFKQNLNLRKLYEEFFNINNGESRGKHFAKRKSFSIDVIPRGSDKKLRISRNTPYGKNYQLYNVENLGVKGWAYDTNTNEINFNQDVLFKSVVNSKKIALHSSSIKDIIKYSGKALIKGSSIEFNPVKYEINSHVINVKYTANFRFDVEFKVNLNKLPQDNDDYTELKQIPIGTKFNFKKKERLDLWNKLVGINLKQILPNPRDFWRIINISNNILTIAYRVDYTNEKMKEIFNNEYNK